MTPATATRQVHYQHNDSPHDGDPARSGRTCGPHCDLYEPADNDTADEERAMALLRFERDARAHGDDPRAGDFDTCD